MKIASGKATIDRKFYPKVWFVTKHILAVLESRTQKIKVTIIFILEGIVC